MVVDAEISYIFRHYSDERKSNEIGYYTVALRRTTFDLCSDFIFEYAIRAERADILGNGEKKRGRIFVGDESMGTYRAIRRAMELIDEVEIMARQIKDGTFQESDDPKTCLWEEDAGVWQGECGIFFSLGKGTPSTNKMSYCPHCGRPIEEEKQSDIRQDVQGDIAVRFPQKHIDCRWVYTDDEMWQGECGIQFSINDGTPEDNGMIYCPRCGRIIMEA